MNKKLNTEEVKFMIPDYISGMLNDADKALVSEAIKESEEVREFYNEMKGTFDFVSSVKFKEPAPAYWNSLLPRIHEKIDSREAEASGFSWDKIAAMWKVLVPIAAVILIAVIYYLVQPSNIQLTEEKKTEEIKKNELIKKDSSKDEKNIKEDTNQEKVIENNNDNIVKDQNDGNKTKNNSIKKNIVKPDNATAKNIVPEIEPEKESQEPVKDEQFALDIEETSMFADGEGAGFDEETENDLKKLNDNEKEVLLQELKSINL